MKNKVIFFLSPEVTGAERVSITMAKQLNREEYDVSFAILGNTFGDIISYIPNHFQYRLVPLLRLDDFLKDEQPDEVFCSLIHLNGEVLDSARRVGNFRVILRNNYLLDDVSDELRQKATVYYPKADMVIAQTEQMKKELIAKCGVLYDRIKVVDNPIDKEYIDEHVKGLSSPYPNDDRTHFCWVGRYDWIKGVDVMIKAFNKAYQNNHKISLYLIGKDIPKSEYYQSILEYVEKNQLQEVVHFIGFKKNPYIWIAYADCLIVPSRSEANSNVMKETAYLGVPIISTCKSSVESNQIHYCEPEDVNQMAAYILEQVNRYL
jgi:glycosyltransferase involved in cell wall biosynthesis